ncbi:DEP domain-containing protein 7-like [Oncorhynchus kisutch]|uniref:DEP domain-containing protein 7-like n=1 Tax=Oncorhynchus kisutch TaxID=8019 RepID=UPI0012DE4543|nr:DEP domain-containing protein 7-like [Oncorhynchus kisutch]
MEAKVFEAVGTKLFLQDKEATFEDTGCSLYCFQDCGSLPGSAIKAGKDGDTENMAPEDLVGKRKKGSSGGGVEAADVAADGGATRAGLHPGDSDPGGPAPPPGCRPAAAAEPPPGPGHLQHLPGRELPQTLNLPELDAWLVSAADCLELFPDQLIVLAGEHLLQQGSTTEGAERLAGQTKLLFDTMAKHYGGQERSPLLTGRYLDIHTAILDLLDCGKVDDAFRAYQLCLHLHLLRPAGRDELRRLLAFMATAAHPDACRLHKQTDNRALVSRTFLKAIVQNKELSRTQSERLLLFLMDNHTQLFKTPTSLIDAVRRTLQILQQGRDPNNIAMFTFCQQVSLQQYEDQCGAATLESLKQLIRDISLSKALSVKERRRLVKEFQKHHPIVFSSTF